MAKRESTNAAGKDAPYYRTSSGIIHPVANMGDGITGTPPSPGLRGGPGPVGSGNMPLENRSSMNPVVKKFFKKD